MTRDRSTGLDGFLKMSGLISVILVTLFIAGYAAGWAVAA